MSGNTPSVGGANTFFDLLHFWHPMWGWSLNLLSNIVLYLHLV